MKNNYANLFPEFDVLIKTDQQIVEHLLTMHFIKTHVIEQMNAAQLELTQRHMDRLREFAASGAQEMIVEIPDTSHGLEVSKSEAGEMRIKIVSIPATVVTINEVG